MATMKAFGFSVNGGPEVIEELIVPKPVANGRDLVVKIKSGGTNPVDIKVMKGNKGALENPPRVTGFDGAGIVESVGPNVKGGFKVGDEVFFAGLISRHGTLAEYTAVDERIVGFKPKSLSWDQAASIPLVAITVWEAFFEELQLRVPTTAEDEKENAGKVLLIIGGAGGVGSMAIQIAKKLLKLQVIATATRPESIEWCKKLGADYVVAHHNLAEDFKQIGVSGCHYVLNCDVPKNTFDHVASVIKPFGRLVNIAAGVDNSVDVSKLFAKRASLHWEFMFARPMHDVNPESQGRLLNEVAALLDKGVLMHNLTQSFPFTLAGIKDALTLQQSGKAIGKIGFHVTD